MGSAVLKNRDFGRTIIDVTIPNSPPDRRETLKSPSRYKRYLDQCISNGANCYLLFESIVALLTESSGGCEAEIGIRSRYCRLLIHSDYMIVDLTRLCEVLEENHRKVVRLLEYGWIRIGDPVTLGHLSNQWPFNEFIKGMGSRCASQIWRPNPRREQETLTGVDHPSTDQGVDPTPTPTDQATDPIPLAQTATARAAKKERHDLRDQLTLFKQRTQALEQQVARLETQNHLLKLRLTVRSPRSEIHARLQVFQRYGAIDSCWAIGIMHHELEDLDRRIQSLKVGLEVGLLDEALSALQNRLRAPVLNPHPEALERERVLMSGKARSGERIIVDEAAEVAIARLRDTAVVLNADSTLEEEPSRVIRESSEMQNDMSVTELERRSEEYSVAVQLSRELLETAEAESCGTNRSQRRFSQPMKEICFIVRSMSPRAYQTLRLIFPFPSDVTLGEWVRPARMRVEQAIGAGTDDATTGAYLQEYRERHKIGSDEKVFVTLAHDATSATAEGVWMVCEQERGPSQESQQYPERELSEEPVDLKFCFTFMMLPLNHDLPNLVIRSTPYQNGKIDDFFLTERNHLTQVLTATNFVVLDVATDGDPAMNPAHLQFFERCVGAMEVRRNTTGDLDEVCEMLFTEGVTEIPVSDPYHLFKRCRQRLIHADTGLGLQSCIK